ncbi:MAG: response regulator [Oligoflexia bacterium]|nr:response regulator [Oligoflexia bacterium]
MSKSILIADDAPIIRLMLKDIITPLGYQIVAEAANGEEAIQKYKEFKPDLVTMDIIMPIKNGIEALSEILKLNPKAKVLMISAIDQKEYLTKAIKIGATDYIVKPFEEAKVQIAIKKALGDHKL